MYRFLFGPKFSFHLGKQEFSFIYNLTHTVLVLHSFNFAIYTHPLEDKKENASGVKD